MFLFGGVGICFCLWIFIVCMVVVCVNGIEYVMILFGGGIYELELLVGFGVCYFFVFDGVLIFDFYVCFLFDGVYGEVEVVDFGIFDWIDVDWYGIKFVDCVFYEVYVGIFILEGIYCVVVEKLLYLKELGVMVI